VTELEDNKPKEKMTKRDYEQLKIINDRRLNANDFLLDSKQDFDFEKFFRAKAWNIAEFVVFNKHFSDFYESRLAEILEKLKIEQKSRENLKQARQSGDKLNIVNAEYESLEYHENWVKYELELGKEQTKHHYQRLSRMRKYRWKLHLKLSHEIRAKGLCVHCRKKIAQPAGRFKFPCPSCGKENYAS
jgi:hypothetical protein